MSTDPTSQDRPSPPGEKDPNVVFASVGHALSCWEQMETELAWLYTVFIGRPGYIDALADYGNENGIFKNRLKAVSNEAERYFQKHPDQTNESAVVAILNQATDLSIVRHRIAHGILRGVHVITDPATLDPQVYFLGAPWYATKKLRANWLETDAGGIDRSAQQFIDLANRITTLLNVLNPEQPRELSAPRPQAADDHMGDHAGPN